MTMKKAEIIKNGNLNLTNIKVEPSGSINLGTVLTSSYITHDTINAVDQYRSIKIMKNDGSSFIMVYKYLDSDFYVISDISVLPNMRGLGLGADIANYALDFINKIDPSAKIKIWIDKDWPNTWVLDWYRSFGFVNDAADDNDGLLWMTKAINNQSKKN